MAHFLVGDIESTQGYLRTFIKERPEASQGASHYAKALDNAPMREVSNDDYVGASVKFKNGCVGFLDASRIFYAPTSRHCFEIFCEKGSILWNFEEMNTLHVFLRDEEEQGLGGYRRIYSSPSHPSHKFFNPSDGSGLGYDDLKVIEIAHFLENISKGRVIYDSNFCAAAKVASAIESILHSDVSKKEEVVREIV